MRQRIGGKKEGYLTETEIYKRLSDPNDPLTFLIAVQKGKNGIKCTLVQKSYFIQEYRKEW